MSMDPADYERRAEATLLALRDGIDALGREDVDAELSSGVLTIEFSDGARYVVNSQRAARQIWLAAERRAWHFDWQPTPGQWVTERGREELWSTLEALLSVKLGAPAPLGAAR